uniref:Uncharacterized protein n=1 Tax=Glycine max TaxID=3847 RepID=A0A0R0K8L3_SOYBN
MGPTRALERRLRTRRRVRREIVLGGMGPTRPAPGRWREVTKERFESHWTPNQVQAEPEVFHWTRFACGVWERNARRACLS